VMEIVLAPMFVAIMVTRQKRLLFAIAISIIVFSL
jgi:hypothetical protein